MAIEDLLTDVMFDDFTFFVLRGSIDLNEHMPVMFDSSAFVCIVRMFFALKYWVAEVFGTIMLRIVIYLWFKWIML